MTEAIQLLQINIISAQDLATVARSMNTYVVGWVNPNRKLTTRVDHKGNNSPEWNDRFVFRVSPEFLESNTSTVELEIYCQTWLRDTLVGFVRVAVPNLLPTDSPNGLTRRSVALQIRRPSGRPQGILNVIVSVVDGARRSMPLSGFGTTNDKGNHTISHKQNPEDSIILRREKSERSWAAMADQEPRAAKSPFKGHDPGPGPGHGQGPRSSIGGGASICNSDVGPSASVVAAAVAKGLYMPPAQRGRGRGRGKEMITTNNDDDGSSILQWADEQSEDGIVTKIERWKMEMQKSLHGSGGGRKGGGGQGDGARHKHKHRRSKTEGGRLFRCFGKAYGFEFTIVCGSNNGNNKQNIKSGKKKVHHNNHNTSDDESNSRSYIIV